MIAVLRPTTVTCLSAALAAQCVQSSPPFAGSPLFLSMSEGAVAFPEGLLKCEGFAASPIGAWPASAAPDFNFEVVLRALASPSCSIPSGNPLPDIDALSLGIDWILADQSGRVVVPPSRWGALTFAVSPDSVGTPGSAIRGESTAAEGPGTDVFSYVLPGSTMPTHLVGRTLRAQESGEIGLPRQRLSIDGLDHFIALYRSDPMLLSSGLLSPTPTLYFSVTAATISRVPAPWWGNGPRSGAVIFSTTWNPAARKWSCVQPWRLPRQLGLQDCEDLDALALDLAHGHILFSTAQGGCVTQPDQIMHGWLATDGDPTPVPYTTNGTNTVSASAGIGTSDDVKAICSLDPLAPLRSNVPNTERVATGTPNTTVMFPNIPRRLESTMFMTCWSGGPATIESYGLGWVRGTPVGGAIAAYLQVPGSGAPPVFVGAFARDTNNPICGDPKALRLPLPPHLRLQFPAVRVEIAWVGLDPTVNGLGQSFPVGLDL